MTKMNKTYSELSMLETFEERLEYLKTDSKVGDETFGYDRYLNQSLYSSKEWKQTRDRVIIRDNGCDLGVEGYPINSNAIIHHLNPITKQMIVDRDPMIFDPNNLITVSHKTHNAIHYGGKNMTTEYKERTAGDTIPWKR